MADPNGVDYSRKESTACVHCRLIKLACSKDAGGCERCTMRNIRCIYIPPESKQGRKRGPYAKRQGAAERALARLDKMFNAGTVSEDTPASSTENEKSQGTSDIIKAVPQTPLSLSAVVESTLASPPPSLDIILELWHLYTMNVDPIVKVIHCPSFSVKLFEIKTALNNVDESMEAILLSIYHAAVSSTPAIEIEKRFGTAKSTLLDRYKPVLEKQLAVASSRSTPDIMSLQAITLFLVCLHRKDDIKIHWTTFTLAVRIAQQLLNISSLCPFDIELLRRCWWTLCRLESRQTEDANSMRFRDIDWCVVPLPLNVNDSDIYPAMKFAPQPRQGITDMTFCVLGFQLKSITPIIWNLRNQSLKENEDSNSLEVATKGLKIIQELQEETHSRFLQHCHESRPLDWLCIKITRIILTKITLLTKIPTTSKPAFSPYITSDEKFLSSIQILEDTYELQTDPRIRNWTWYFRDFIQWHALTFVLSEYCRQPLGPLSDKAWTVLDPILLGWDGQAKKQSHSEFLDPVNRLIEHARRKRQEASKKSKANQPRTRMTGEDAAISAKTAQFLSQLDQAPIAIPDSLETTALLVTSEFADSLPKPSIGAQRGHSSWEISPETYYGVDFDLPNAFDAALEGFDWDSWADFAQGLDLNFGFT